LTKEILQLKVAFVNKWSSPRSK